MSRRILDNMYKTTHIPCGRCDGSGKFKHFGECFACEGSGGLHGAKLVRVKAPPAKVIELSAEAKAIEDLKAFCLHRAETEADAFRAGAFRKFVAMGSAKAGCKATAKDTVVTLKGFGIEGVDVLEAIVEECERLGIN